MEEDEKESEEIERNVGEDREAGRKSGNEQRKIYGRFSLSLLKFVWREVRCLKREKDVDKKRK